MGDEQSAEQRAYDDAWQERENWMNKMCNDIADEYYEQKGMEISVLIAPVDNDHDDTELECLETREIKRKGKWFKVYIGGKGRYINKGARGFGNWSAFGYDHRQDDNVMILGDEHGQKYLDKLEDEKLPDEFISIEFDTFDGLIKNERPCCVFKTGRRNYSYSEQTYRINRTESVEETSEFIFKSGTSIKFGTEFTCGLPLVAEQTISTEFSQTFEFTKGSKESNKKEYQIEFNAKAKAGHRLLVKAVVWMGVVEVPYVMTFRRKGRVLTERGIWKGVRGMELNIEDQEARIPSEELRRKRQELYE